MVNQNNCLQSLHSVLKEPSFYALLEKSDIWPNGMKAHSSLSLDQSLPTTSTQGDREFFRPFSPDGLWRHTVPHPPSRPIAFEQSLAKDKCGSENTAGPLEKSNACVSSARKAVGVFIITIIIFLWAEQVTGHNNIIYSNLLLQIRTF